MLVLSVRFVVSTTSSSPTQRARESPRYCRIDWFDVRPPVGVEDARVVDHLVADRHHARRLHDAVAVAVDDAQHRADDAAGDAAIVEREVLRCVERTVAERAAVARCAALLGLGRDRRLPAVGRVDDERGLAERASCEVAAERADGVLARSGRRLRLLLPRRPLFVALIEPLPRVCGRCSGMPCVSSLDHTPCRSGSPHGVFGAVYGIGAPPL